MQAQVGAPLHVSKNIFDRFAEQLPGGLCWLDVSPCLLRGATMERFDAERRDRVMHLEELYEAADAEGKEWREFIAAWWEKYQNLQVDVGQLLDLATQRELLGSVVGDKGQRSQRIRLGRALGAARDRRFGELCVRVGWDKKSKQQSYALVRKLDTEPPREPGTV